MRFKGTFILLIVCLLFGGYLYFYEIKGGEKRAKAKEDENRFWMLESKAIRQIEILPPGERIVAERKNDEEWTIQLPRPLEADSGELNRLADSAAGIKYTSILEESTSDPARFGLSPARSGLKIITDEGEEHELLFGQANPSGNSRYARVTGREEIFLVSSSLTDTFDKKLDDLRNHTVLKFEQSEVETLNIQGLKGDIQLVKDGNDRWWIEGEHRIAADSPQIRGILNAMALGKIPEFFDEDPDKYINTSLDKPTFKVSLTYGKDKAIKGLRIGSTRESIREKGTNRKLWAGDSSSTDTLYLAKDESRPELFFVDNELVNKLDKSVNELRDTSIAAFQRWDIDSIILENSEGRFNFAKVSGEWFLGDEKQKASFEAVTGILDALGSDSVELVENPAGLSIYGLDKPAIRVTLRQAGTIIADCSFGKSTEKGVYARLIGDPSVKMVDPENYEKLTGKDTDYLESEEETESETAEE